jgi:hypothetical protein
MNEDNGLRGPADYILGGIVFIVMMMLYFLGLFHP